MLSPQQIAQYRADGFIVVPDVIDHHADGCFCGAIHGSAPNNSGAPRRFRRPGRRRPMP